MKEGEEKAGRERMANESWNEVLLPMNTSGFVIRPKSPSFNPRLMNGNIIRSYHFFSLFTKTRWLAFFKIIINYFDDDSKKGSKLVYLVYFCCCCFFNFSSAQAFLCQCSSFLFYIYLSLFVFFSVYSFCYFHSHFSFRLCRCVFLPFIVFVFPSLSLSCLLLFV